MQTQLLAPFARLLPGSRRLRPALLAAAVATAALASVACFGDDDSDEPAATLTAGSVATATAEAAGPTAAATTRTGSLTPGATATPAPTLTDPGPTSPDAPQPVALFDLQPCGDETLYEEIELPGGIPALTYKEVPSGTPILFPFEHGSLRHVDAKEGEITLTYDVEDVGVVTFKAAGSSSLVRNLREPVAGTVIGEFGTVFGEEDPQFADLQLIAVAGTEDLILVGDQYYVGEPLDPEVTDCLPLP